MNLLKPFIGMLLLCVASIVYAEEQKVLNPVDQIQDIVQKEKAPAVPVDLMEASKEAGNTKEIATSIPENVKANSVAENKATTQVEDLEVLEFVLANRVDAREPKEIVDTFGKEIERGFAFARLHVKKATEVTFLWYHNDQLVTRFSAQIHPSKKWRTYSSVKMRPGQWKVQLLQNEKVLAEKSFFLE